MKQPNETEWLENLRNQWQPPPTDPAHAISRLRSAIVRRRQQRRAALAIAGTVAVGLSALLLWPRESGQSPPDAGVRVQSSPDAVARAQSSPDSDIGATSQARAEIPATEASPQRIHADRSTVAALSPSALPPRAPSARFNGMWFHAATRPHPTESLLPPDYLALQLLVDSPEFGYDLERYP